MRALKLSLPTALICVLLLGLTGCQYNQHRNLGATEKWVASDVNYVPKILGTVLLSIGDAFVGPVTMLVDHAENDRQYHPDHLYFSYAASRTNGRSEMGLGYQWMVMFPTFIADTVFLPVTGLIDLVAVLGFGDDGDDHYGDHHFPENPYANGDEVAYAGH
ncbi:MAG: hypothetical protein ACT4PU_09245 [Planctomycetota bacterium]